MARLHAVAKRAFHPQAQAKQFTVRRVNARESSRPPSFFTPGDSDIDRPNPPRVFTGPSLSHRTLPRILGYGERQFVNRQYFLCFDNPKEQSINSIHKYQSIGERIGVDPRKFKHTIMKCYIQFMSTPTADTPGTTLLIHFDGKRYLVGNIAEGAQRAAMQRKLGLAKVGDMFITGTVGWANAGGLLGMILTLADVTGQTAESRGISKAWLNIHGGKNLTHLLGTARRFIFRKGMPIYTNEYRAKSDGPKKDWEPTWTDDRLKVWAMVVEPDIEPARSKRKRSHDEFKDGLPIDPAHDTETPGEKEDRHDQMRAAVLSDMFDSDWKMDALVKKRLSQVARPAAIFCRDSEGKITRYHGPTMDENPSVRDIDVLVRNPWPGALIDNLPPTSPSTTSVCYIIKNHPQRGKFNPKDAIALGVKPGPDFRRLTAGESVTTADGKVVTPDMVMAKGTDGGGFAIVELPNETYVGPLIARPEWLSKDVMLGVGTIIWILGHGLVEDPRLLKFMRDRADLKHIVSSKDCCPNSLALESAAANAIRLHLIDNKRFQIPKFNNSITTPKTEGPVPYYKARAGLKYQLEPTLALQEEEIVPLLNTLEVVQQGRTAEDFAEVLRLAQEARSKIESPEYQAQLDDTQKDLLYKDAEIITLGTGSASPSKYRNVSATMLRVPGVGSYLFDCGENTLGQLRRVFGDELPGVLRDLKAIWISHLHADHHLGTASIITAWAKETADDISTKDNKLIVSSDLAMLQWLKEYAQVEDYGYERLEPLPCSKFNNYRNEFQPEQTERHGLTAIEACPVQHCSGALAVVFTFSNGFKVSYSGDCRPSNDFAKLGKGSTLLIHEATFDDELQGDAKAKKHSTTSEALDIGMKMEARRILLTHFSQRYSKIPVMEKKGGKDQIAIVAFDYMRCKLEDFAKLEAFKPALMKLYEKEAQSDHQ